MRWVGTKDSMQLKDGVRLEDSIQSKDTAGSKDSLQLKDTAGSKDAARSKDSVGPVWWAWFFFWGGGRGTPPFITPKTNIRNLEVQLLFLSQSVPSWISAVKRQVAEPPDGNLIRSKSTRYR